MSRKNDKDKWIFYVQIVLLVFGTFLLIDRLTIHAITYNASILGVGWLDQYLSHGMYGALFIALGLYPVGVWEKKIKKSWYYGIIVVLSIISIWILLNEIGVI